MYELLVKVWGVQMSVRQPQKPKASGSESKVSNTVR